MENYPCPAPDCRKEIPLSHLMQHVLWVHPRMRGRFIVIDKEKIKTYTTDGRGVRIGELEGLLEKEEKLEVPAAA